MPQPGTPGPGAPRDTLRPAVLVGVDGTAASRTAIVAAAREAAYRSAPLIAIQAFSGERIQRGGRPGGDGAGPAYGRLGTDDNRRAAESGVRDAVRDVLGAEWAGKVQALAVLGLAGRQIVETARQVNAQLIVLATHGSRSMLLGTVSQYVLRRAPCPVLVVPVRPAGR